ncbi:MAG: hydroxymethylglutaryl-CoA synthase family protein [Polyangiaceae bacterium]|nr:hydroxymethylglutaryl-CoA synthase family protein [Polyangiaceae bacterium]
MTDIGIEKLGIYPGSLTLDLGALCRARGMDAERTVADLMIHERSLNPPWEDAVTMGVNAAMPMLSAVDRASVGLLLVGTESAVDQEKPVSSWLHGYLGLPDDCLNLEVKHACFAATGALDLANAWLESSQARGRKALVVATDQTTMHIGKPWEPVGGAGAVAMLLSREPRLVAFEPGKLGIHAEEVSDVIRPNMRVETGNSETSLFSYLTGIEGAYPKYVASAGEVDFDSYFKKVIYHVPFGGMTYRAHKTILRDHTTIPNREARAHWDRKTAASLVYNRRIGTTYGGSTFIALTGLVDTCDDLGAGDRIGIFAYGSGSCAQFYSAILLPHAREVTRATDILRQLDARRPVTVAEYEALEIERDASIGVPEFVPSWHIVGDWYDRFYAGKHRLVLKGVHEYYREYAYS